MNKSTDKFYKNNSELLELICKLVSSNEELRTENETLKTTIINQM